MEINSFRAIIAYLASRLKATLPENAEPYELELKNLNVVIAKGNNGELRFEIPLAFMREFDSQTLKNILTYNFLSLHYGCALFLEKEKILSIKATTFPENTLLENEECLEAIINAANALLQKIYTWKGCEPLTLLSLDTKRESK